MFALDFLRDIGKQFRVNYMLSKRSVKSRIETGRGVQITDDSRLFRFSGNEFYRVLLPNTSILGFLLSVQTPPLSLTIWRFGPVGKYYCWHGLHQKENWAAELWFYYPTDN
eukprot:TRINITY_DN3135_c0_g1_i14.p2 TRINITY_DN3135_c0_g1~~TRINITY_DN3135_c0_g1_i14.p2  ORF type:complete len:111 (-),score=5.96 TRINITY_DN3135_c0_g1_i14:952-1284(-)